MKRISLTELIDEVAEATGSSKKDIRITVEILFEKIKENLVLGNSILIWRFGVFTVKKNKARKAHNVNTNTIISKPETSCPKLEFSRNFKDGF